VEGKEYTRTFFSCRNGTVRIISEKCYLSVFSISFGTYSAEMTYVKVKIAIKIMVTALYICASKPRMKSWIKRLG
jgi:hypothetical protein